MEKPKRYEIKKLYLENAEVKDYVVKDLIERNKPIQIILYDETMTLSPEELKTKLVKVSKTQSSKFNKGYKLYAYKWNPDKIEL